MKVLISGAQKSFFALLILFWMLLASCIITDKAMGSSLSIPVGVKQTGTTIFTAPDGYYITVVNLQNVRYSVISLDNVKFAKTQTNGN